MPPLGKILKLMCILALIGLAVALLIGAAIVVVPVAIVGFLGLYIYKRQTGRVRYDRGN
jgi:hypothetical protein